MTDSKYKLTLAAANELSPMFRDAAETSSQLTGQLREQEQELRRLNATSKNLNAWRDGRRELELTSQKLEQAKARTQALAREMAVAGEPSRQMKVAFASAKRESDRLQGSYDRQKAALHGLKGQLRTNGVDVANLGSAQGKLRKETTDATAALERQKKALDQLATAQTRLEAANAKYDAAKGEMLGTAAMVGSLAYPVARSVAFESAMADVKKTFDFQDGEEQAFTSDIRKLAVSTNTDATDLTAIAAAAGQAGVAESLAELKQFTESAARMGVAFDIGADEAGETMAAWRAGMALSQEEALSLANAVNHVSNSINAKARDISEVLKRQGAVATSSGLTADESASLAGAILSSGATSEVAATTMKNMLGALTKGDAATGTQRSALASLGFDPTDLAADMQSDAVGTIKEMFEALADAPIEEQSSLISQLFGDESKGGIMPLLKNLGALDKAFGLTADKTAYSTSMMDEYNSRIDTRGHQFGAVMKSVDRLMMVVGDSLLPILGPAAEGLATGINAVADLAEAFPPATAAVTGLTAAVVGYKAASIAARMVSAKMEALRARSQIQQAKLATTQGTTAKSANLAAAALSRLNKVMNQTAAGGGGFGGRGRRRSRGRRGGKWGRLAGMAAGGAGLMALPAVANAGEMAMAGADIAGMAGDLGFAGLRKVARPLDMLLSAGGLVSAVTHGNSRDIGSTAGDIAGGMGGAMAGAALGSMILPGIGTVLGGVLGGLGGGELGSWLGDKVGGLFEGDRLSPPDSVAPRQMIAKLDTTINLEKAPAGFDEEKVAQMVVDKQKAELLPMFGAGPQNRIDDSLEVAG